MDIYTIKGSKVIFTGKNGDSSDLRYVKKYLKVGETYTVNDIIVHDFSSTVTFEEIPNRGFNTVHFKNIEIELTDWDKRFLDLAEYISNWSKDRSTKVGCVVVDSDKRIVSTGYNGFIRNSEDNLDYKHERPAKYFFTVHSEVNAIYYAAKTGVKLDDCTIYTTLFPCAECCKGIIQSGINKVVTKEPDWNNKTWGESFNYSKIMFEESNIEVIYR